MQVPRVRFGLRGLMVLVAISAVVCWLEVRRQRFQALAVYHAYHTASFYLEGKLHREWIGVDLEGRPTTDWESAWHSQVSEKYRQAVRQPWLPVDPNPDKEAFRKEYRAERVRRIEEGTLISRSPSPPSAPPLVSPKAGVGEIRIVDDPLAPVK